MLNGSRYLFPELAEPAGAQHSTGILPTQDIERLIAAGSITASEPIRPEQVQPASLDLRIGPVAYRVDASFLPESYKPVMNLVGDLSPVAIDLTGGAVLERGKVYIIPAMEELSLPSEIMAKANPKSTIGRLDVLTRLITDYGAEFERAAKGYRGKLYVEVAPRTFSIMAHQGDRLNQLRFRRGNPPFHDSQLSLLHQDETLVYLENEPGSPLIADGLWVTINLEGPDCSDIVGYRARTTTSIVDLSKLGHYDPREFWEIIRADRGQRIILQPGDFYILASRERVRVPPAYAAEMVGYDPSVGEFRIHYAGFFDPGFGYGDGGINGTPAVLEVRSHEVPFLLRHGQRVGRLLYERLLSVPRKIYGAEIGSSYGSQSLTLSKQFRQPAAARTPHPPS
jgi:dCTP deaminase